MSKLCECECELEQIRYCITGMIKMEDAFEAIDSEDKGFLTLENL